MDYRQPHKAMGISVPHSSHLENVYFSLDISIKSRVLTHLNDYYRDNPNGITGKGMTELAAATG